MDANGGTSAAAMPLEYAPAPPRWRRRMRRWIWLFVLCVVGAAIWRWHADIWNRAQLIYWQQRCLNYSAPADMIVCTNDSSNFSALVNQPDYLTHFPSAGHIPFEWTKFIGVTKLPVTWPPSHRMDRMKPMPGICFLGELRSPSGQRRLVVVECTEAINPFPAGPITFILHAHSITPGGIVQRPGNPVPSPSMTRLGIPSDDDPIKFTLFAGQRDPNDPSHFTIRYTYAAKDTLSLIEGRLKDDGDVEFTSADVKTRMDGFR